VNGVSTRPIWTLVVAGLATVASLRGWRFSSERELTPAQAEADAACRRHLEVIAAAPRSLGSAHHERVSQYLADEARMVGAEVDARAWPSARASEGGPIIAAVVRNVVATVAGRQHERAVLVMGHYDTVSRSPGAGDDGVSVAAMLVALRSLRTGPVPKNDVIFLFSDGEEAGRLGAAAFLANDPRASRVRLVLNFEGRGSEGPPLLFETGTGGAWTVPLFARAVTTPLGTSLSAEVYKRLRNDTDFTPFREVGIPGLNIASIDGFARYHSATDDIQHLGAGMVHDRTDLVSRLTHAAAEAELERSDDGGVVFFSAAGVVLVTHGLRWSFWIALASLGSVVVALRHCARQGTLRPARALACAPAIFVLSVVAGGVGLVLGRLVRPMADGRPLPQNGGYVPGPFFLGLGLVVAALVVVARAFASRRVTPREVAAGGALLSATLALVVGRLAPGASYLFAVPAAAAALSVAFASESRRQTWVGATAWSISIVIVAIVSIPAAYLLSVGLGPAATPLVAAVFAWIATLMLPAFPRQSPPSWRGGIVPALGGVVLVIVASRLNRFDADQPRPDAVLLLTDARARRTVRASTDGELDDYSAAWVGPARRRGSVTSYLPEMTRPIWMADAPFVDTMTPAVTSSREPPDGRGQLALIDVRPATGTSVMDLRLGEGARPETLRLGGAELALPRQLGLGWVQVWAMPPEGIRLGVRSVPGASGRLGIVARSFTQTGGGPPPRPPGFMPLPFGFDAGDMVAARSEISF
jgi:hypothetical protein